MSVQSDWQPASRNKPAEFVLDYVSIKVQAFKASDSDQIQVRLATAFDTDWMEREFEGWYEDAGEIDDVGAFEALYPMLKSMRAFKRGDELALLNAAINELEQSNSGLIRG